MKVDESYSRQMRERFSPSFHHGLNIHFSVVTTIVGIIIRRNLSMYLPILPLYRSHLRQDDQFWVAMHCCATRNEVARREARAEVASGRVVSHAGI